MNENYLNVSGYVGTDVHIRMVGEGTTVASFRVASTPRRWNNQERQWIDLPTNWYTVNAWRMLGRNCADSLKIGDAVTVYGKLTTQVWTDDAGSERQTMVLDAAYVGHDLNKGSATFERNPVGGIDHNELAGANVALGVGGPQVSSDGQVLDDLVEKTESTSDDEREQDAERDADAVGAEPVKVS